MMNQSLGLEKVKLFPHPEVRKIAVRHWKRARERIFGKGQDKDGTTFKSYTEKYAELKARRFRRLDGKPTKSRSLKTLSLDSQTSPPNLTLTRQTKFDFKVTDVHEDGYSIGWEDRGIIMIGQRDQGRDAISDIPQDELDWVADLFAKNVDKQFKDKIRPYTKITVGK
jgi:hypothetical protein